jgi:hypothetical protein
MYVCQTKSWPMFARVAKSVEALKTGDFCEYVHYFSYTYNIFVFLYAKLKQFYNKTVMDF